MAEAKEEMGQTAFDLGQPATFTETGARISLEEARRRAKKALAIAYKKRQSGKLNPKVEVRPVIAAITQYHSAIMETLGAERLGPEDSWVDIGKEQDGRIAWYDPRQNVVIIAPEKVERLNIPNPTNPDRPFKPEVRGPDKLARGKVTPHHRVPPITWINHGYKIINTLHEIHEPYRYVTR